MSHNGAPQNVFMDQFTLEPKIQRVWDMPHATWFTLMGVGGGVFVLGRLLDLTSQLGHFLGIPIVDVISIVAIAVGGLILIADLGRPFRFWRAFLNVRSSWISWGAICDAIFLVCGGLLVLSDFAVGDARPFSGLPWDAEATTGSGRALELIAGIAALVVMFYAGAVLAKPRAIPFWHSARIPFQFIVSAAAVSMAVLVTLGVANEVALRGSWFALMAVFIALLLAAIVWHLVTDADAPGKSHSLELLIRGRYRTVYLGGVTILGTGVPLVVALLAMAIPGLRDAAAIITLVLLTPAAFLLRLITLRVGVFPPVRQPPALVTQLARQPA